MHERERRGGGLQRMAPVVVREAVVAREAGASPVTAREAVVAREVGAYPVTAREAVMARKDPMASTAAPVALTRPCGSVALARLRWRRRRTALVASTSAGDGSEVGRRQIGEMAAGWVEGFGGEVVAAICT